MSVVAITWAWKQQVRTTIKFVLLALADFADDHCLLLAHDMTPVRASIVS